MFKFNIFWLIFNKLRGSIGKTADIKKRMDSRTRDQTPSEAKEYQKMKI